MRKLRKTERGIALLATMLGMVLMTVVVMDFTTSSTLGFRSAANQANQMRAEYLGLSGVNVGMALLAQDARQEAAAAAQGEQSPHDGFDKLWAQPFPPIPVGGGLAGVSIVDETRKLDVNQIIAQDGTFNLKFAKILARLFAVSQIPPEILPAIINWIGVPGSPFPAAAGADYYLRLTPPYAPRDGPIPTIGDLRMVRGVDDVTFNKLSQFLTVVPDQQVNVNTAPPEVLASLSDDFANNPNLVKEIIAARTQKPIVDIASLLSDLGSVSGDVQSLLTIRSDYFTISGRGSYAGARKIEVAIVHREGVQPPQLISCYED